MNRRKVTYKVTATTVTLLAAVVILVTSCSAPTADRARVTYKVTGTAASTTAPVTSQASTSAPAAAGIDTASQAREDLQRLVVVARRPYVPGYQRSCGPGQACSFGAAWTDDQDAVDGHNGCSTRDDVLAAQLRNVTRRAGSRCVVVAGILTDPYTGATITFSKSEADLVPWITSSRSSSPGTSARPSGAKPSASSSPTTPPSSCSLSTSTPTNRSRPTDRPSGCPRTEGTGAPTTRGSPPS
jgi:hypothetical protein